MKKIVIAGTGLAALGLAVLPVAGTFADVTDTTQITVSANCSVGGSAGSNSATGGSLSKSGVANGSTVIFDGQNGNEAAGTIKVSCNNASGWNVKAVGASTGGSITSMAGTNGGTSIDTGTSGDDSYWAFKVAGSGFDIVNSFDDWHVIPDKATKVVYSSDTISEGIINTNYKVFVNSTQEAGTYTGKVTYTVASGVNG